MSGEPATHAQVVGTDAGASVVQAGEIRAARVESLRAIGALGVLFGHVFFIAHYGNPHTTMDTYGHRALNGVAFGAFMLFGLSGFLIYGPFARRDFGSGGPVKLANYALNRALRIFPLYFVALGVVMLLQHGLHVLPQDGSNAGQWWRFATFTETFTTSTIDKVDGVMWTLVVELHFYLLLPLLALGLARLARGSLGRAALWLGALGLASLACQIIFVQLDAAGPSKIWDYSTVANFFWVVAGMELALLRVAWERRPPRWARGPVLSADMWLLASVPCWLISWADYRFSPLMALAGFFIIGAVVLPLRDGRLVRALEWRPLAAVGIASYSLYLWHFPVTVWLLHQEPLPGFPKLFVQAVPLCIVIALLSYRFVEAPFLGLRRRWSRASARQTGPHSATATATS